MILVVLLATLACVSPAAASCGRGLAFVDPFPSNVEGHVAIPAFSYNITTGPLNWHNLNTTYYLCGNGTNVSF